MKIKSFVERRKKLKSGKILSALQSRLMMISVIFNSGLALSNTFDNIFLFSRDSSIMTILIFNFTLFLSTTFFSFVIPYAKNKISIRNNVYIGILSFIVFYIMMMTIEVTSIYSVVILGCLKAIGTSFYNGAFNVYVVSNTKDRSRDYYFSLQSVIQAIVSTFIPLISSYSVKFLGNLWGYVTIFSITIIALITTMLLLYKVPVKEIKNAAKMKGFLSLILKNKALKFNIIAEMTRGLREGVMTFLTGVLLYQIFNEPTIVGYHNLVGTSLGFVATTILTKKLMPHNRSKMMFIGSVGITLSSAILISYTGTNAYYVGICMFLFGVIAFFFSPFLLQPSTIISLLVLQEVDAKREMLFESMCAKEAFSNVARAIGVLAFILAPKDLKTQTHMIATLSLFYIATWFFTKKSYAEIQKQILAKNN